MEFIPIQPGVGTADRNLFISDVHVVTDNSARDALTVQEGDVCKVTNDNKTYIYDGAAWVEISASITNLDDIGDVTITSVADKQLIQYDNGTTSWKNVSLTTSDVSEGTRLYYTDEKVNTRLLAVLTTNEDLLIRKSDALARLSKGTDGQYLSTAAGVLSWVTPAAATSTLDGLTDVTITTVATGQILRKSAGDWTNQTLDSSIVTENTNLYYTDARVDTRLNSKYSAKGRILVGTGNNTYSELPAPTTETQCLFSEIDNVLNTRGVLWRQPTIIDNSDVSITAVANNQYLRYNSTSTKWENTGTFNPNRIVIQNNGTAALPGFCFANNTQIGAFLRTNLTAIDWTFDGVNVGFSIDNLGNLACGINSSFIGGRGLLSRPAICVRSDAGFQSMGLMSTGNTMDFVTDNLKRASVNATSFKVDNRLDVINTELRDNQMRINNTGNSFTFTNSAGSADFLKIDVGTNPRVTMPQNKNIYAYHDTIASTWDTNITANNTWVLINNWNTNNALVYATFGTCNQGTITVGANAGGTYKVTVDVSCLVNDGNNIYFRLSRNNNTTFIPGMCSVTANNVVQSCSFSSIASLTAGDVLRLATTSFVGPLPKTVTIHTCSICITNIFNT